MMECLILGDSIAQGVSHNMPNCAHETKVGITSQGFVAQYVQAVQSNHVLISLGSNDGHATHSLAAMRELRRRVRPAQVTWLISANNERAAQAALIVARENQDRVIWVRNVVGSDGVHPTAQGYYRISQMWRYNFH